MALVGSHDVRLKLRSNMEATCCELLSCPLRHEVIPLRRASSSSLRCRAAVTVSLAWPWSFEQETKSSASGRILKEMRQKRNKKQLSDPPLAALSSRRREEQPATDAEVTFSLSTLHASLPALQFEEEEQQRGERTEQTAGPWVAAQEETRGSREGELGLKIVKQVNPVLQINEDMDEEGLGFVIPVESPATASSVPASKHRKSPMKSNSASPNPTSSKSASPNSASAKLSARPPPASLCKKTSDIWMLQPPSVDSPTWLPPPPLVEQPKARLNPAALAFMGDSVYELFARRHFVSQPSALSLYCSRVTEVVRCEAQDYLMRKLLRANFFTPQERDVLRWGRNSAMSSSSNQRRARGRAGNKAYNNASALETLIGYLYLTDTSRLQSLMAALGFGCDAAPLVLEDHESEGGGEGGDRIDEGN